MAGIHLPAWKPVCGTNAYFRGQLTSKWLKDASQLPAWTERQTKTQGESATETPEASCAFTPTVCLIELWAKPNRKDHRPLALPNILWSLELGIWTVRPVWYVRGLERIVSSWEAMIALLDLCSLLRFQTASSLELKKDKWSDPAARSGEVQTP